MQLEQQRRRPALARRGRAVRLCVVGLCVVGLCVLAPADHSTAETTGAAPAQQAHQIGPFQLTDFRGKTHRLDDYQHRQVLVVTFLGTECPLAKLYGPRLASLAAEFESQGVGFLGINANRQDSLSELAAYARRHNISFPILKDGDGKVARQFGATRTPEVFVLDDQRVIRYQGRIDDQYGVGYSREAPARQDLQAAVVDLLAGRRVQQPRTEAVGCLIGRFRTANESSDVTYSNQIARLINKHCLDCHRDGEIAPFALSSYEEVVGWADMMEEVVRSQRMPPWHANPAHGQFANSRLMSEEEKQLLYEWVRQGAPAGNPRDLPELPTFVTGWRLPKEPDVIISMRDRPFSVPAEGVVEYQYFAVDPGFTEDKWVSAADVTPGKREVVHHVIVFVAPPETRQLRGLGWLTAYVPGQSSMQLPAGQARLVPAGSKFIFQMHYTPNGAVQEDMTRLGLVFADPASVTEEVVTTFAVNEKFEIPPHATNYEVSASLDHWPQGGRILSLAPHMHVRGKSFRFVIRQPGVASDVLLDIPHYDFNWQNVYRLAQPLEVCDDLAIDCVAHYDNSESNLVNPDPSATVRWGDQTFNEMMIAFFEVALPRGAWEAQHQRPQREPSAAERAEAERIAGELVDRFDTNGDGRIARDEAPSAFRVFAFRRYDGDGDRVITRDEALRHALRSLN